MKIKNKWKWENQIGQPYPISDFKTLNIQSLPLNGKIITIKEKKYNLFLIKQMWDKTWF